MQDMEFSTPLIQTMPGKAWFTIFRLYNPLEAFFDKSWQIGEIELVSS